jgi:putative PIN family toxin of toxin-antitoxin system
LIISRYIIDEIERVLSQKFQVPKSKIRSLVEKIENSGELVPTPGFLNPVERDPKDDNIVETAINGNAHFLITGDKDLLSMEKYEELKIINSSSFFKQRKIHGNEK